MKDQMRFKHFVGGGLLLHSNRSLLMLLRRRFFALSSLWAEALIDTGREHNKSLKELIRATQSKVQPEKWTNLTVDNDGWLVPGFSGSLTRTDARVPSPSLLYRLLAKLQLMFLFIFGVFIILAEYIKRLSRVVKPVRVSALTQ